MSYSTTTGQLAHCVLELCHAKTTTSVSQAEVHLQATPEEQFSEDYNITDHSTWWHHNNDLNNTRPNTDAEVDMIPVSRQRKDYLCCEANAVNEHVLICQTHFVYSQTVD